MRVLLSTLILQLIIFNTFAQRRHEREYDFSTIDPKKIDKTMIRKQMDSVYRASKYDSLLQLTYYLAKHDTIKGYLAFTIGYQSTQSSLTQLKNELRSQGFSSLSETFAGIPWGLDIRTERLLLSYLISSGIKNGASNNDYKVDVKGFNAQIAVGYDVLNLNRLHLYHNFRFSIRISTSP